MEQFTDRNNQDIPLTLGREGVWSCFRWMLSQSVGLHGCSMVTGVIPSQALAEAFTASSKALAVTGPPPDQPWAFGEQCLPRSLVIYGGLVLT